MSPSILLKRLYIKNHERARPSHGIGKLEDVHWCTAEKKIFREMASQNSRKELKHCQSMRNTTGVRIYLTSKIEM